MVQKEKRLCLYVLFSDTVLLYGGGGNSTKQNKNEKSHQ